jgi:hypothetical protein
MFISYRCFRSVKKFAIVTTIVVTVVKIKYNIMREGEGGIWRLCLMDVNPRILRLDDFFVILRIME